MDISARRYLGRSLLGEARVEEDARAGAFWEAPFALLVQVGGRWGGGCVVYRRSGGAGGPEEVQQRGCGAELQVANVGVCGEGVRDGGACCSVSS